MKALSSDPRALRELEREAARYDDERPGLGDDLIIEVTDGITWIRTHPEAWETVPDADGARRFVLSRFPFKIVYLVDEDSVHVLAVAPAGKPPGHWRGRR